MRFLIITVSESPSCSHPGCIGFPSRPLLQRRVRVLKPCHARLERRVRGPTPLRRLGYPAYQARLGPAYQACDPLGRATRKTSETRTLALSLSLVLAGTGQSLLRGRASHSGRSLDTAHMIRKRCSTRAYSRVGASAVGGCREHQCRPSHSTRAPSWPVDARTVLPTSSVPASRLYVAAPGHDGAGPSSQKARHKASHEPGYRAGYTASQ